MYIVKQWVSYSPSGSDENGEWEASYSFNLKAVVARTEFERIEEIFGKTFATVSHGRNPHNGCGDADSDLFHVTYTTSNTNLFHQIGGNVNACENSYELHWLPFVATEKDLAGKGLIRDRIGELPRPKPVLA